MCFHPTFDLSTPPHHDEAVKSLVAPTSALACSKINPVEIFEFDLTRNNIFCSKQHKFFHQTTLKKLQVNYRRRATNFWHQYKSLETKNVSYVLQFTIYMVFGIISSFL